MAEAIVKCIVGLELLLILIILHRHSRLPYLIYVDLAARIQIFKKYMIHLFLMSQRRIGNGFYDS